MPAIKFDELNERIVEAGVKHGVIFVGSPTKDIEGKAWNGLTNVTISPEGGDANDQYADDIKYISLRGAEQTNGSIEALTVPTVLYPCMGLKQVGTGLDAYFAQQNKTPFSFCYITTVGNAETGLDLTEKLHVVWNATLDPVEDSADTINESPEGKSFSFNFSTVPLEAGDYKPTARFEITKPYDTASSTYAADLAKYNAIKDALYGSASSNSKLLLPSDILTMLAPANPSQPAEG